MVGCRQPARNPAPASEACLVTLQNHLEGKAEITTLLGGIDSKQYLGCNLPRQLHHLLMEIADLTVFPARHHSLGKSNDGPAVDRQAFTLESRLHQTALPEPKVPLAH